MITAPGICAVCRTDKSLVNHAAGNNDTVVLCRPCRAKVIDHWGLKEWKAAAVTLTAKISLKTPATRERPGAWSNLARRFNVAQSNEERFWANVDKTDTCWNWRRPRIRDGYGVILWYGVRKLSHRVSYEMARGPIPDGLMLDHLCRNRACVNPDHLEPVTNRENIIRGAGPTAINSRKTHCVNGHPFSGENLRPRSDGGRRCRDCQREVDFNRRPLIKVGA